MHALSSFPQPQPLPPVQGPGEGAEEEKDVPEWVQKFNDNMSQNMAVTVPLFLVVRNGTWYALAFMYGNYFSVGPEFAVAYLLVKLTGKFRRPVDIGLAAILSKAFPVLGQVKVSTLFAAPPQDEAMKKTGMGKVMAWVSAPMDKYGFSFYIACKLTGFVSIAGIAMAIRHGLDISSALTYFGVPDIIQDASAAFGVATLTNIILIPAHFALVATLAPIISARVKKYNTEDKFKR
jgi:hypothetical protein